MLITFEGIDGSGKSTQIHLLKERLEKSGIEVDVYREPGGTGVSEKIRSLLLNPAYEIDSFAELLLFSAARAQLVSEKIRPALERGRVVVCDRFYDSTTAYQGAGRGLGEIEWMIDFHAKVTGSLVPTRTYLLSVPVEHALERRSSRAENKEDRMEQTGALFFERVVQAYKALATRYQDRFFELDGTQPVDVIHSRIWDDILIMRQKTLGTTVAS